MTVPLLFALIGGVILVGFLANLLFRLTKIPSVLILVALGVVLGPITGWIRSDSLLAIAPYFGAVALLVILFEGGLELEIAHVVIGRAADHRADGSRALRRRCRGARPD
jgi:cell volume regulation protein A